MMEEILEGSYYDEGLSFSDPSSDPISRGADPFSVPRRDKPVKKKLTIADLIIEFDRLLREAGREYPQARFQALKRDALAGSFSRWKRNGMTMEQGMEAIRIFFSDKNIHARDFPYWRQFISRGGSLLAAAERSLSAASEDIEWPMRRYGRKEEGGKP